MQHKKKIIAIIAFLIVFSFLGLPIPDWLSGFVNALAGIITGFSKLIAFVQFFVHF